MPGWPVAAQASAAGEQFPV